MTDLPHGFSTDFSEAPADEEFWIYALLGGEVEGGEAYVDADSVVYWAGLRIRVSHPLCWCPIPTPGDAVLKQLAEEGK